MYVDARFIVTPGHTVCDEPLPAVAESLRRSSIVAAMVTVDARLVRWVHRRLLHHFGRPEWPESYAPLDELIGTILSQHTSDVNSERAFASLKASFRSWEAVRDAPVSAVQTAIRSGGLAVVKAERIQAVLSALTNRNGVVELPDLRRMRRKTATQLLMDLPGVGRKTAACVLLFGSHIAALPVDTHVHRVSLRLGLVPPRTNPDRTADALEHTVRPSEYYALHVNLIRLGREICKAPRPRCEVCPLRERCATGRLTPNARTIGSASR